MARTPVQTAHELYQQGNLEHAEEILSQAVRSDPNDVDALIGLGGTLGRLGRFRESLEASESVIDLEPENAKAHYMAAFAHAKLGAKVEARAHAERAVQLAPQVAQYHLLAAGLAGWDAEAARYHMQRVAQLDRGLLKGRILSAYVASWVSGGFAQPINVIVILIAAAVWLYTMGKMAPADRWLWDSGLLVAFLAVSAVHLVKRRYYHAIWVLCYYLVALAPVVGVRLLLRL